MAWHALAALAGITYALAALAGSYAASRHALAERYAARRTSRMLSMSALTKAKKKKKGEKKEHCARYAAPHKPNASCSQKNKERGAGRKREALSWPV